MSVENSAGNPLAEILTAGIGLADTIFEAKAAKERRKAADAIRTVGAADPVSSAGPPATVNAGDGVSVMQPDKTKMLLIVGGGLAALLVLALVLRR